MALLFASEVSDPLCGAEGTTDSGDREPWISPHSALLVALLKHLSVCLLGFPFFFCLPRLYCYLSIFLLTLLFVYSGVVESQKETVERSDDHRDRFSKGAWRAALLLLLMPVSQDS